MPTKTYRAGVIGLRGIAANPGSPDEPPFERAIVHSHTASLALLPNVEVAGYCDLTPELLDDFDKNWGKRWPNAKPYADHKEMLAKESLDILGVATSEHLHADITVDAVNAGVKGILCEKPIATTIEDADRMIKACDDNGVALAVDHTRRWNPRYHKVRDAVRSGAIGSLGTIVATLGGPRAMLFANGTHLIDMVCFFAESQPTQVFARLEDGYESYAAYTSISNKDPANDPALSGFILFENGVRAMYCGEKNTFGMFSFQLSGPDGQVYVNDSTSTLVVSDPDKSFGQPKRKILPGQYQVHGIAAAYQELIDVIENGGESVSSGREALKTLKIMLGFLRSQQEGARLIDISG